MCKPGYCSDVDLGCHEGAYRMLSTPFRITTKTFGEDTPLYMTRDGKVKMGDPPSEASAIWHVSLSASGTKHLVTGAFRDVVLEEHEECADIVDGDGFPSKQCLNVVGQSSELRADTTGWRFELHSDFFNDRMGEGGVYLQIKNAHTGNYMFINPPPLEEAHVCIPGGARCPGEYAALLFSPPFPRDMLDIPDTLGQAADTYLWSYGLVVLVMIGIWRVYSNIEAKTSRFDDDLSWCIVIPLREFARAIGLRQNW